MELDKYSEKFIHYYISDLPPIIRDIIRQYPNLQNLADLGCGDGSILYGMQKASLLNIFKKIYAVDISKLRTDNLKNIKHTITSITSDVCDVPEISDNEIDLVISTQVIEHVPNDETMIKETKRIMRSGGIAYFSTVFKKWYGWYFYKDKNGKWVIDPTHEREYTKDTQLTSILERYGFDLLVNKKTLQWFPVTDFFLKRIGFKHDAYIKNPLLNYLRIVKIPIPGYYNWEIVFRKK